MYESGDKLVSTKLKVDSAMIPEKIHNTIIPANKINMIIFLTDK